MTEPPLPPVASPERPPSAERSKRTMWMVVGLLAALVACPILIGRYQPLTSAGLSLADPTYAVPWAAGSPGGNGFPVYEATYTEGQILRYGFFLHNDGPLGVTVTSLEEPAFPGDAFTLEPAGAALGDGADPASIDPSRIAPFRSFSLGSGEARWIVLEWRFRHCSLSDLRTSMTFFGTAISYRVLGFTHHVSLDLPIPVEVPEPPRAGCPGA